MERIGRRALLNAAIGVAVAALVVVAAVDAVRRPAAPKEPAPLLAGLEDGGRKRLARALDEAGVEGILVLATSGCRLVALPLAAVDDDAELATRSCSPAVSPRDPPRSGWFVWRAPRFLVARCAGRGIDVVGPGGRSVRFIRGCPPAWLPDGTLSYVRRGEVTRFPRAGRAQVVLARNQLARPFGGRALTVRDLTWATDDRLVALLARGHRRGTTLAVFHDGRVVARRPAPGDARALAVSPGGDRIAFLTGEDGRAVILDRDLTRLPEPGLPAGNRDLAWSPDGRWLALAGRRQVALVAVGEAERVRLPVSARAVAWR